MANNKNRGAKRMPGISKRFLGQSNDNEEGGLRFNKKLRRISISGPISQQMAEEFFDMLSDFELLASKKPLTIFINSEGGDTYAMFKIYDHIKNSPIFITTIVAGYASSAGFIIFLAGDLRKIFSHAFLGFHAPTLYYSDGYSEGPAEIQESALHQNRLLNALIKIVKDNSNMPEKMIREYFCILTRVDAQTALKLGLAHQIISPQNQIIGPQKRSC